MENGELAPYGSKEHVLDAAAGLGALHKSARLIGKNATVLPREIGTSLEKLVKGHPQWEKEIRSAYAGQSHADIQTVFDRLRRRAGRCTIDKTTTASMIGKIHNPSHMRRFDSARGHIDIPGTPHSIPFDWKGNSPRAKLIECAIAAGETVGEIKAHNVVSGEYRIVLKHCQRLVNDLMRNNRPWANEINRAFTRSVRVAVTTEKDFPSSAPNREEWDRKCAEYVAMVEYRIYTR